MHTPLTNPLDQDDEVEVQSSFDCRVPIKFVIGNDAISTIERYFSVHFQSLTIPSFDPV